MKQRRPESTRRNDCWRLSYTNTPLHVIQNKRKERKKKRLSIESRLNEQYGLHTHTRRSQLHHERSP